MSDTLRDRIRRLLALAEHPGTPQAEVETAMAQINTMVLKYDLDLDEIRGHTTQDHAEQTAFSQFVVSTTGGHGPARRLAACKVIAAFGGRSAYTTFTDAIQIDFIAMSSAVTAPNLLLPSLMLQMETAAQHATREHLQTCYWLQGNARRRESQKYRRNFMIGFAQGVAQKVEQAQADVQTEVRGTGKELALLSRDATVERAFTTKWPKLRKGRSMRTPYSVTARAEGRRRGLQADLGQPSLTDDDRPQLP